MPIWIPITIAGAFFQNLRSALQKHLSNTLSGQGAAYSRFCYALPWAVLYWFVIQRVTGSETPGTNQQFWMYCFLGGISQILATVFLLKAFSYRSFAVATVLSKLEILVVAFFGLWLLGDSLSSIELLGVLLSVLGLLSVAVGKNKLTAMAMLKGLFDASTFYGLLAALGLGASVIFFRGASLALEHDIVAAAAAFTLLIALTIQTVLMGVWLKLREPGQLLRVANSWRWASLVGISGMLASACWFTAFTLQNASHVRALGQIELLFTLLVTSLIFKERVSVIEYVGCAMMVVGILLILLGG